MDCRFDVGLEVGVWIFRGGCSMLVAWWGTCILRFVGGLI